MFSTPQVSFYPFDWSVSLTAFTTMDSKTQTASVTFTLPPTLALQQVPFSTGWSKTSIAKTLRLPRSLSGINHPHEPLGLGCSSLWNLWDSSGWLNMVRNFKDTTEKPQISFWLNHLFTWLATESFFSEHGWEGIGNRSFGNTKTKEWTFSEVREGMTIKKQRGFLSDS